MSRERTAASALQVCIGFSGLEPNTTYALVVPKGTNYGSSPSTLTNDVRLEFTSTLPFTIPFPRERFRLRARSIQETADRGVSSKQLNIFFPHGLAEGTASEDVRSRLTVEQVPAPWGGPPGPLSLDFSVNITSSCAPTFCVCQHYIRVCCNKDATAEPAWPAW